MLDVHVCSRATASNGLEKARLFVDGTGLNINCTADRLKRKRGRKAAVLGSATSPSEAGRLKCLPNQVPADPDSENQSEALPEYPVLNCLSFDDSRGPGENVDTSVRHCPAVIGELRTNGGCQDSAPIGCYRYRELQRRDFSSITVVPLRKASMLASSGSAICSILETHD